MELDIYLLEKDNEIPRKKKQVLKREKSSEKHLKEKKSIYFSIKKLYWPRLPIPLARPRPKTIKEDETIKSIRTVHRLDRQNYTITTQFKTFRI